MKCRPHTNQGRDQPFKLSSCYCQKRQSDIPPGQALVPIVYSQSLGDSLYKEAYSTFCSPEWPPRTCLPANIVSLVLILLHYCLYSVVVLCFLSFAILPKVLRAAAEFSLLSGSFVRALYRRQAFQDVDVVAKQFHYMPLEKKNCVTLADTESECGTRIT